ncbi:hypothetical protein [Methylomicrobium sp. Wu6]|uniref:hypothetical protein n=1 Tax=Methylomicrobium sp. Wu6 TaxID=3107928 RepID=UPI002DD68BCE|nr:hypothetical protein [Methylomicrobium sp. Wu6]MEC4749010.1 hypothetical protein [Methylomicrobium sp. Wu6]
MDGQICRLLGAEGLMLIPLYEDMQNVGVIAAGINKSQAQSIAIKAEFITLFSREAARALLNIKSAERSTQWQLEDVRENYRSHAKKLAHEASNPLSIIQNYLYLLSERVSGENAHEISIIQDEIDRVGKLLLRLPNIAENTQYNDSGMVDVNSLIIDLGKLFQTGMFALRTINIDFKLDNTIPQISVSQKVDWR